MKNILDQAKLRPLTNHNLEANPNHLQLKAKSQMVLTTEAKGKDRDWSRERSN